MPQITAETTSPPSPVPLDEAAGVAVPVPGGAAATKPARRRLVFAAQLAIGVLLVWWLIRTGRFVPRAMLEVRAPGALLGAALCQCAMIAGIALRWPLVLRARGLQMPLGEALRLGLAGQFAAVWTPAGLGLDGARALDGVRRFPGRKADVFKAAALDRVCAFIALLVLCIPGGLWLFLRPAIYGLAPRAGAPANGSFVTCCVLYFVALAAVGLALFAAKATRAWAAPTLLALAVHVANAGAAVLCFAALGGRVTFEGLAFAAPLVVLSSIIPLTPLGIGVVDGAAAEVFSLALMPGAAAATMLARAVGIALSLACGALALRKWPFANG